MVNGVVICGYSEVEAWLLAQDFHRVVSIGAPGSGTPEALDGPWPRVLRLEFVDTAPYDYDPDGPREAHVEALLDFCDGALASGGPTLFHCAQVAPDGWSRFTYMGLAAPARGRGRGLGAPPGLCDDEGPRRSALSGAPPRTTRRCCGASGRAAARRSSAWRRGTWVTPPAGGAGRPS